VNLLEQSGYRVVHGVVDAAWFLPQRRERVYFVGIRRDLFDCDDDRIHKLRTDYVAFTPKELKDEYQIYDNDLDMNVDKYARLLDRLGTVTQRTSSTNLSKSEIGDILEPDSELPSHCFLTMHQWKKIQSQTYLQLHNDGSGQLITEDEPCSQTLVSSYRQSYLLHSQFIVSSDSFYLTHQQEILKAVALDKTKAKSIIADHGVVETKAEEQLPRFFSLREW
jgi:site-specific DNA-cytosine methylase